MAENIFVLITILHGPLLNININFSLMQKKLLSIMFRTAGFLFLLFFKQNPLPVTQCILEYLIQERGLRGLKLWPIDFLKYMWITKS